MHSAHQADTAVLDPSSLAERRAWARARGLPYYLWPEIPIPAWRGALAAVERAVGLTLKEDSCPTRLLLPADTSPRALGIAGFTSGLGPLLGYWIESGRLEAAPDVALVLREHLRQARIRCGRVTPLAQRALSALDRAGISPLVVKGGHTSLAHFPDPATRPMADLDLVVEAGELAPAKRTLEVSGFRTVEEQPAPLKVSLAREGEAAEPVSIELTHPCNPWAIELHASMARDFFRVRTVDVGPPRTEPLSLLGVPARRLAEPWLTAYLALHASEELHRLPMLRLVELVLVIREGRRRQSLDFSQLGALLARHQAERFSYPALELAEHLAPGLLPSAFREQLHGAAPPRMRRVIARLTPATAQRLASVSVAEKLMWARGPLELSRRLSDLLWPIAAGRTPRAVPAILAQRAWRVLRGGLRLSPGGD